MIPSLGKISPQFWEKRHFHATARRIHEKFWSCKVKKENDKNSEAEELMFAQEAMRVEATAIELGRAAN